MIPGNRATIRVYEYECEYEYGRSAGGFGNPYAYAYSYSQIGNGVLGDTTDLGPNSSAVLVPFLTGIRNAVFPLRLA